ncbi:MAG: hypothetical protein V3S48_02015 [Candidatus Neomarinimicrobiota bacterium]
MFLRKFKIVGILVLVIFSAFACTTVNYIGNTLDPTTNIDTYYSKDDIKQEYIVIGHAIGLRVFDHNAKKIHEKLIKEAKINGADAILITGIGKSEVLIAVGSASAESQVYALFLKYK